MLFRGKNYFNHLGLLPGGQFEGPFVQVSGNIYYVNSATGSDSNSGRSWVKPFLTIAYAVAQAAAGDTIAILGSFTEAVTVAKAGLRIVGCGTGPNQAIWTAATDAICLTIGAANVLVQNIKFQPPARTAGTPAAIKLSAASYATIRGCRFQGKATAYYAIYSPVCDSDNVTVEDCEFIYMNTAAVGTAILGVEAGGLSYSAWKIRRNVFNSCVKAIDINGRICEITDNLFLEYGISAAGAVAAVMALGIDLSGTSSGANVVTRNQLGGTYDSTLYKVGASGDQWAGNFNVLAGGVTAANPT